MTKAQNSELQFIDASVIIPTQRFDSLTQKCINECLEKFPGAEVILLIDETITEESVDSRVTVVVTGEVTIAKKRNLGCELSSRSILAFIDSDAYPNESWLTNALTKLSELPYNVAAVCGPNVPPQSEPLSEYLVGLVTKSNLVVINAHFLKTPNTPRFVSAAPSCNLLVKKQVYLQLNGMDENLVGGEDFEFCSRLRNCGYRIFYCPDIVVYHKNRNIKHFILQRLAYGGFTADRLGKEWTIKYLITLAPFIFLIYLMLLPFLAYFQVAPVLRAIPISAYFLVVLVESLRTARKIHLVPATFTLLILATLSPAFGTLLRLIKKLPDYRLIYNNDKN